uniref:Uncharacterized protein n=1 Tax=Sphaerodactylus townsendi TaxID=933632 RepID=A0ACB8G1R9_9SAUR
MESRLLLRVPFRGVAGKMLEGQKKNGGSLGRGLQQRIRSPHPPLEKFRRVARCCCGLLATEDDRKRGGVPLK